MIAKMQFFIDNFHLKGHKKNCKKNFNIKNTDIKCFEGINTSVAEQTFAWFSQFQRITRHMNPNNFIVFIICICHLHNVKVLKRIRNENK